MISVSLRSIQPKLVNYSAQKTINCNLNRYHFAAADTVNIVGVGTVAVSTLSVILLRENQLWPGIWFIV